MGQLVLKQACEMGRVVFMAISECPECTFHIQLEDGAELGQIILCPDCGEKLKLVSVNPPIFEAVKEE